METAKKGDTVKVHYTGRLEDGTVFDTSDRDGPIEFTIGEGTVIPGFEEAVLGMSVGDESSARIPAAQAYGERAEDALVNVPHDRFPAEPKLEIGQRWEMRTDDGGSLAVVVREVREDVVVVDGNHPLAGRELTFDLKLVAIA